MLPMGIMVIQTLEEAGKSEITSSYVFSSIKKNSGIDLQELTLARSGQRKIQRGLR